MRLHLIDGTYELFRAFYSKRPEHTSRDGQDVKAIADLQTAVREHQSGEPVQLKVRRGPDEIKDITIIRP